MGMLFYPVDYSELTFISSKFVWNVNYNKYVTTDIRYVHFKYTDFLSPWYWLLLTRLIHKKLNYICLHSREKLTIVCKKTECDDVAPVSVWRVVSAQSHSMMQCPWHHFITTWTNHQSTNSLTLSPVPYRGLNLLESDWSNVGLMSFFRCVRSNSEFEQEGDDKSSWNVLRIKRNTGVRSDGEAFSKQLTNYMG
jgi:hypothetical protein